MWVIQGLWLWLRRIVMFTRRVFIVVFPSTVLSTKCSLFIFLFREVNKFRQSCRGHETTSARARVKTISRSCRWTVVTSVEATKFLRPAQDETSVENLFWRRICTKRHARLTYSWNLLIRLVGRSRQRVISYITHSACARKRAIVLW